MSDAAEELVDALTALASPGARLRAAREAMGMTAKDVARALSPPVTERLVLRWETEPHMGPTGEHRSQLGDILRCPLWELWPYEHTLARLYARDLELLRSAAGPNREFGVLTDADEHAVDHLTAQWIAKWHRQRTDGTTVYRLTGYGRGLYDMVEGE